MADFKVYSTTDPNYILKIDRDFPDYELDIRDKVSMDEDDLEKIKSRDEVCSIRIGKGEDYSDPNFIWVPRGRIEGKGYFPLSVNIDGKTVDSGGIRIPMIVVARLKDFPDFAIMADGYNISPQTYINREYMNDAISKSHGLEGRISPDRVLTGNFVSELFFGGKNY